MDERDQSRASSRPAMKHETQSVPGEGAPVDSDHLAQARSALAEKRVEAFAAKHSADLTALMRAYKDTTAHEKLDELRELFWTSVADDEAPAEALLPKPRKTPVDYMTPEQRFRLDEACRVFG